MKSRITKRHALPFQRSLGKDLHKKRSRFGLTQERMAEYLEISVGEYKKIERHGHIPKTARFLLICWKLRLNPFSYLRQALGQEMLDTSVLDKELETI